MNTRLLNKTAVRDLMDEPPKGQRLIEAFGGNWDLLTDSQVLNVRDILVSEFGEIESEIKTVIKNRHINE